ncbi:MAG TPA: lanthionine synthetase LanC family protein [Thermoanaerobaculia bacterium]|nr:lanthionine synthetase LanC family protein [Thermoanaerobaculia bacterium]
MAVTDPLLLLPDALLVPVADLSEEVRGRFEHQDGDFALTHPRLRAPSRILDAPSAELLEQFRTPRTIVEAVIRYSQEREADPEATLEAAYPLLERLLAIGFLVPEGAAGAEGILPLLRPGEMLGAFEVRECVQELEDTDLYQARGPEGIVALKVARSAEGPSLDWEAAVLRHLDGAPAPRLLATGESEGRRYLALEWCSGVDAGSAAGEARRRGREGRRVLLALCREICAAYARLHERGVVHGDLHPRNVLVGRSGSVRLVDFGSARWDRPREGRAGVAFFFEPEYAAAVLAGRRPPEASVSGEQYALAALLYLLSTGAHYRDFRLEKEAMLRQIAEDPPLSFADRGVEPWPEVEEILGRALAKDPGGRFPSMAALAEAFGAVRETGSVVEAPARNPMTSEVLARVLARVEAGGDLYQNGIPDGSAGVACALYRFALAREDASLLSLAELWAARAVAAGDVESFRVQALIAHSQGLPGVRRQAVSGFLQVARQPCDELDLTVGRSGALLAAALLLDLGGDLEGLTSLGDDLLAGLWSELDPLPAISEDRERPVLGIAHGWAGYLYASLQWCRAAGRSLPPQLRDRLDELGACARPWGRGLRWRWHGAESRWGLGSMAGWCNGSAGYVFLWTLAHRTLGDPAYAALAEGAAWNAWEDPSRNASLCCGFAGRAYALLNLYKHGGGPEWMARARDLAERAAREASRLADPPHSLYKGEMGIAVLAADLPRPEAAAMPFFEEEGWS